MELQKVQTEVTGIVSQIAIFWFKLDFVVKRSNSKLFKFDLGWPSWLSHHKSNSWNNPWLGIYGSLHPGKGFKPNFHYFSHSFAWWRCFLLAGVKGQWPNHPQRGYLGRVNSDIFLSGFWTHLTDENRDYHHIIDNTYSLWNFEDLLKSCNIWTWLFQISMKSIFNSKYLYIFILYLLIFSWSNSKLWFIFLINLLMFSILATMVQTE